MMYMPVLAVNPNAGSVSRLRETLSDLDLQPLSNSASANLSISAAFALFSEAFWR